MKKLDFLIIGVQKAGTTALDSYLREHNEVCMGDSKEIHYFDNELNFHDSNLNYDDYHKNFSPNANHKLIGEATPIYIYWKNAIERIWRYNPNIKIIILLRDPIQRAYSHWNMEVQRGADKLSFSEAIRIENSRAKSALPEQHRVYSYVDRGFYSEQIRNVWRYFEKSQVLIIKNEDLKNDPDSTLGKVTNFLNISNFKNIQTRTIHSREYKTNISFKDFDYLKGVYFNEVRVLEYMLDIDLSNWLVRKKKVLFYRDFRGYTGGHQKVYDYFTHLKESDDYEVDIVFSKETLWDKTNPWYPEYKNQNLEYNPNNYDIVFLAGMDWKVLDENIKINKPIINLIQHVRHSYKLNPLYKFLGRKATRICVSNEVTKAISDTNKVNGKIFTVENGHKLNELVTEKKYDIYILGNKNPKLASEIEKVLQLLNINVLSSTENIYREDVFYNMSSSKISILLPNFEEAEGFYLPALESMKYSDLTIVPDCVGNRTFCKNNINCLMPLYELNDIIEKALIAMRLIKDKNLIEKYKNETTKTLKKYNINRERESFLKIMDSISVV